MIYRWIPMAIACSIAATIMIAFLLADLHPGYGFVVVLALWGFGFFDRWLREFARREELDKKARSRDQAREE